MKYKWLIGIGLVAIVGGLVWINLRNTSGAQAGASATQGPKGAPLVKVATLKPRDLTQTVLAPGTLEVAGPRELRAPFTTMRVHLLVGAGDEVKAGQVVAELEADDLRVQVAAQVAAVARAESAVAQLQQQRAQSPLLLSQKLEAAKGQLLAAQSSMESALRAPASAKQRLEQAQASLLAVQNRAPGGPDQTASARQQLQAAEQEYRNNPLSATARKGYDDAKAAYEAALRAAGEAAKQAAADLAQARQALSIAQADFDAAGENSVGLQQARQAVESAKIAVQIAEKDAESGGVLVEQIRSSESDLASARASLSSGQEKLEQASMKADRDGVVLSVGLKDGQPAQQGALIMEIGGMQTLLVKTRVDEVDVGKVKPGQELSVKTNAYPQDRFTGKVTRVAPQSTAPQPGTAAGAPTYEVQGEVQNKESKLRGGMSTETRIVTETRKSVFVVGLESVREEGEKAYVLVTKDFKVELREVKLGLRTQTQVQVVDGLKEGEKVVVSPFTFIKDAKNGDSVRIDPKEAEIQEEQL